MQGLVCMVAEGGIEPPTQGFSVLPLKSIYLIINDIYNGRPLQMSV